MIKVYCSRNPDCSYETPCSDCIKETFEDPVMWSEDESEPLVIGQPIFTEEQTKLIEEFLDKNKDLMDDLVKAGD